MQNSLNRYPLNAVQNRKLSTSSRSPNHYEKEPVTAPPLHMIITSNIGIHLKSFFCIADTWKKRHRDKFSTKLLESLLIPVN